VLRKEEEIMMQEETVKRDKVKGREKIERKKIRR
jgi:hypothetical protein